MKTKITKTVLFSLLTLSLCSCSDTIVPDDNPYSFENPKTVQHEMDAGMKMDGVFDEEGWKNTRWLKGMDSLNKNQYAEINLATFYSDLGVYFGMEVKETGTNIYVNPERETYMNSCIEMYMGPSTATSGNKSVFEMDFLADGTYSIRSQMNSWAKIKIPDINLPVAGSTTLGGDVNTESCYGYTYEIFFPYEFFTQFGYDTSDKEKMELGIDPVHIFSFNYTGKDLNEDRKWSWWSQNYIPSEWLNPSTWFVFGKDGFCSYTYEVEYKGKGKGIVKEVNDAEYIMKGNLGTFRITPVNDSTLTSITFNGVEMVDNVEWTSSYGTITYRFNEDTKIVATFD